MFHSFGRITALALASLGAAAMGCSSTAEISTGRRHENAYRPERLMAIAEFYEKQGNTARAAELYASVRQSSPELAQDAENHLRLMAQGNTRGRLEVRDHVIAQRAAPKRAKSPAGKSKAVAQAKSQSASPSTMMEARPPAAAARAVSQLSRQSPQSQASGQPYDLVGYRQPAASNTGLTTAAMAEAEEPVEEEEIPESGEMPQVTPAPPLEDVQDFEDAPESADVADESGEPADAVDMPESAEAPPSPEPPALEEMQGEDDAQPSDGIAEDEELMDEDAEPPSITEAPEDASDAAPDGDPQEEPADESIPGIDEVLRDLKSADPDRRLAAAQQIINQGTDVAPILRSLQQSMNQATSRMVRVQLADSILLISPHDTKVVRFLLQVEKSDDLAAAALAHELLDSLIDRLAGSESVIGRRDGNASSQVGGSPAVASSSGARAK